MKICTFNVFERQQPSKESKAWFNDSLSDHLNNFCICQELIRYAMLRKHSLE